ncbi:MAG: hypothetical protein K9H61_13145 [Bacteroidia bacterium]|nr:hypothetical protein [Bacteroidia bacterium]MCF8425666.1 hypothetical protein [Bacteroidia bacterium]MCF8447929.1 hypothetical protein [Bacteroidia bacterium]
MGLNQNHTVEELGGMRCAIVEKDITKERADFLTKILAGNGFTVVCIPTPPPKAKAAPAPKAGEEAIEIPIVEIAPPTGFVLGVTDVKFNPINAIYGRILTTETGHFVTPDYWHQKSKTSNDSIPYFQK